MATRRLTAEARRAQLLSVAREVFAEDGYPGAAMEKIAQRAGVTKPVLYQHFEGKKELYLALLDSDMSRLLAQVSGAIESAHDNPSRIRKGLAAYFNYIEANVDSFRLLFREIEIAQFDPRRHCNGAVDGAGCFERRAALSLLYELHFNTKRISRRHELTIFYVACFFQHYDAVGEILAGPHQPRPRLRHGLQHQDARHDGE